MGWRMWVHPRGVGLEIVLSQLPELQRRARTARGQRRQRRHVVRAPVRGLPRWLAAAGVAGIDARRGPTIDGASSMLRAAQQGDGVMIGVPSMYEDEFASGALVAPFGTRPDERIAYYLVYREGALDDPNVAAFREFIMKEAARGGLQPS